MAGRLERIERYYDTVPRATATTEDVGSFTLFVSTGAWSYYARPAVGHDGPVTVGAVRAVVARQHELGVPVEFEWVHENTPLLAGAAAEADLVVRRHPLLVLETLAPRRLPDAVTTRLLSADDPALPLGWAAIDLGFGTPGTALGTDGPAERDAHAARLDPSRLSYVRDLVRRGLMVLAVAEDASGPVSGGTHQPRGDVAEITGVGTLPSVRHRGFGAAITATLAADARDRGVDLVFLSADSDDVARVYERIGFRRIGSACVASVPPGE